MSIEPGAHLTLEIEKAVAGGRMLARHQGRIAFVAGAIPGERVEARVDRVARGVIYADITAVLSSSPDRRVTAADIKCGGNLYSHISYPRQLQLKADVIREAFSRLAGMPLASPPSMMGSPESGYRMRARLHVRGSRIGFYREGTHEMCEAQQTGQLAEASCAWLTHAERTLRSASSAGVIAIELAENVAGDERACHLELEAGAHPEAFAPLGAGLVGLSAQVSAFGNPIRLVGTPSVSDVLHAREHDPASALRLRRNVRSFFQGNRFLLEPLVRRVLALVPAGPVVDLYAGVGLFGLSLAAAGFEDVTLVEDDPSSGADLAGNAEPFRDRVRVERRSVESYLGESYVAAGFSRTRMDPATVVVDPPRTGLSKRALAGLVAARPGRLVYVSCDTATLARDARSLVNAGYELRDLTGVDLFPNTAHVEVVALFAH